MLNIFTGRRRGPDQRVSSEAELQELLAVEQRRSARSGRPHAILQLRIAGFGQKAASPELLHQICEALRSTDFIAWYEAGTCLAILCTEIGSADSQAAGNMVAERLGKLIRAALPANAQTSVEIVQQHAMPAATETALLAHAHQERSPLNAQREEIVSC